MNDQAKYIEFLKTHKRGDVLEVASFLNGNLVKVEEFTKEDFSDGKIQLHDQAVLLNLKDDILYLVLNGHDGTHLGSGRKVSTENVQLKKTAKIEVNIDERGLVLHFTATVEEGKTKRSLPFSAYLLLSFLFQFSVLGYGFAHPFYIAPDLPYQNYRSCHGIGPIGLVIGDVNVIEFPIIERGRGLSTLELRERVAVSPYRDLNESRLYNALRSIEISGELSHREIRRVFADHDDSFNTCKTQFPDLSHSVEFTIYSSNKIEPEKQSTDFSKCAFQTISKMKFPVPADEKPVAVRIRL